MLGCRRHYDYRWKRRSNKIHREERLILILESPQLRFLLLIFVARELLFYSCQILSLRIDALVILFSLEYFVELLVQGSDGFCRLDDLHIPSEIHQLPDDRSLNILDLINSLAHPVLDVYHLESQITDSLILGVDAPIYVVEFLPKLRNTSIC